MTNTSPFDSPKNDDVKRDNEKSNNSGSGGCVFGSILAIICLILECIIFLFCVIGTGVDVFRQKADVSPRACYSMWGYKQCGAHKANPAGYLYKGFPTKGIRDNMNGAAAFAIISIFVTLVSMVLTILLVCKCVSKFIPAIFSILAFFTILIVWACQAGAYYKKYGQYTFFGVTYYSQIKVSYNYAGSFGLFVTAWCLQTIEMILVFFA